MKQIIKNNNRYGIEHLPITIYETEVFEHEAVIAINFCERWGMVAGIPDGEDSAGRSKVRLSTPEEVVVRAFDTAKLIMETARERGLIVQCPDASELVEKRDEHSQQVVDNIKKALKHPVE